jgi:ABC-type hemin transport system ATPase subunit
MIRRLELKRFGRFEDRSFDLAPVTLFHGPNEAGKSTIFDALAKSLCVLRGPQPFLERYGPEAGAKAVYDGSGELKFDSTEYFGFYAVKSDMISIPFDGNAAWMDKVKNSLFSSGVNPEVLAGLIEKRLNSTARKRSEKERLEGRAEAEARIGALKAELARSEAAKERAEAMKLRLEAARKKVADLSKGKEDLGAAREAADAAARLRECRRILKDREQLLALDAGQRLADEAGACDALRKRSQECGLRLAAAEAQEKAAGESLAQDRARRLADEAEFAMRDADGRVAASLAAALEEAPPPREVRRRIVGAASILALSLCSLLGLAAGAFLVFSGSQALAFLVSTAAGIALGLLLFVTLRKTRVSLDDLESRKALDRARSEWLRQRPGSGPLPGEDPARALSFLRSVAELQARAGARLDDSRQAENRAEAAHAQTRARLDELARESARAAGECRDWFAARGASGYEEYLRLVADSDRRSALAREIRARLREDAQRSASVDEDDLASRAKLEIEGIEKRWPGIDPAAGAAGRGEAARLKETDAALDRAKEEEKALLAQYSTEHALAEKDSRSALIELEEAERALERLAFECARDKVQRDAESAARDVFLSMSDSLSNAFDSLSRAVSRSYAAMGRKSGRIALDSLDLKAAKVPDAQGSLRPPHHLSLGTRDVFVLSCRLALAESQRPTGGIVVLDEPFKNLDSGRVGAALEIIEEFRLRSGYQVVLFSKDESLPGRFEALFPRSALAIYDLAR